jgi:hypothetical protein
MDQYIGWLIGLNDVTSIDDAQPTLAAPWAHTSPFWVFLGSVILLILAIVFYSRFQTRGPIWARTSLGIVRGLLLVLLFITLANPMLMVTSTSEHKPLLYVLFDGTGSMSISDELTSKQQDEITKAVGLELKEGDAPPTRLELIQSLLTKEDDNPIKRLADESNCRIQAFVFDGNSTSQLRRLTGTDDGEIDAAKLAEQLSSKGQVTALGAAFSDIQQQFSSGGLAGVVVFSDFSHNSGIAPLSDDENSPTSQLDVPFYPVGIGSIEAVDLSVDVQTDPRMKRAERTSVVVKLRQTGLKDQQVTVTLNARKQGGDSGSSDRTISVGQKTVVLSAGVEIVEFPFTPDEAGAFEFTAYVEPLEGETVEDNNRASRAVNIIDDYLRLMYVAHEPTWEWRFVKEVFHRDKLVGMEGFRTYLASSDPRVRETNVLFQSTLTPKRSEFFANDVIFLGDMDNKSITPRFANLVKEYVGKLGGGLVVISGPRFGPNHLHGTAIADMLPVVIDPNARILDDQEFQLRRTAHADRYAFMRLGETDEENEKAWKNLGKLPWYQPVAAMHEQAFALAEHPTDLCTDGKTHQPLIAIRPYGKGEVIYIAYNEMWRLRKRYGEKYYRQYWSQLIYRLGMSHALGDDKRFVPRLDKRQYRVDDKVVFTVEAYDENYEALGESDLETRTLEGELSVPGPSGISQEIRTISVPMLRPGVFETRLPVYQPGVYTLRVKDPITGDEHERTFEVTNVSAERRSAVRDVRLQEEIARQTGGRSYDLRTVSQLPNDIQVEPIKEQLTRNYPLWSTPLWFTLVVVLMLSEWLVRKFIHLS